MATKQEIALMAHLLRRAGFGAARDEIERRADEGYDATVEWLLNPDEQPEVDEYLLYRYHPDSERPPKVNHASVNWLYRMVNSERPLEEKMGLFWHQVFATGDNKVESAYEIQDQIGMFREHGLGNYRDLLVRLAQNPTMLYWLDNQENHKRAPNENWGRELMELFSLGIGNYTEKDVFEASRAFTGWAFDTKIHWLLWGPHLWNYEFHPQDHDGAEKDYLGHSGKFDGFDVIDIIVRQPACHVFIARHLYNFFVEDEPQVPAWPIEPPRNPEAIRTICEAFVKNDYEIKPVVRTIFTSDFFKESMYQHVRNPCRGRGRHAQGDRSAVGAAPRLGRRRPGADVHGPEPARSPQRRGVAYRSRVDQQRRSRPARQLHVGQVQRHVPTGRSGHHPPSRRVERDGHERRRTRRPLP